MFLTQWLFDKLGYMPKITVETEISPWPFLPEEPVKKKAVARKPAAKKTTRKTVRKKA